jgi:GTPase SAR1 family protein
MCGTSPQQLYFGRVSWGDFGRGMYLIRLLIVGDTGVGKTSLLIRFHEDQFIVHQKTTIGISVHL